MASENKEQREARGFFQRMNDWINKDSSSDLVSAMSRPYSKIDFGNYDYYDDSPVRRAGFGGGHHGGAAHSGYGGYCMEDQVSIGLLVTAIAGIGIMWYTLYTKIQVNGGRKKRDSISWFANFGDFFTLGKLQPYPFRYYTNYHGRKIS